MLLTFSCTPAGEQCVRTTVLDGSMCRRTFFCSTSTSRWSSTPPPGKIVIRLVAVAAAWLKGVHYFIFKINFIIWRDLFQFIDPVLIFLLCRNLTRADVEDALDRVCKNDILRYETFIWNRVWANAESVGQRSFSVEFIVKFKSYAVLL